MWPPVTSTVSQPALTDDFKMEHVFLGQESIQQDDANRAGKYRSDMVFTWHPALEEYQSL